MTEEELRQHIKEMAKPQWVWAKKHGIPQPTVSMVINGRRDVPDTMLAVLGLKRVISYEPIKGKRK